MQATNDEITQYTTGLNIRLLSDMMIRRMVFLFSFMIIISESGPLEDSNLEEDEVEEEFDPSCLPTTNSTDENSDEVDLLQGDILTKM